AQLGDKSRRGDDEPHVADNRLQDYPRDPITLSSKGFAQRVQIVIAQHERVRGTPCWNAGGAWDAMRQGAGARGDEQGIDMAVVATRELDDRAALGKAAREANGAHRCLGPG